MEEALVIGATLVLNQITYKKISRFVGICSFQNLLYISHPANDPPECVGDPVPAGVAGGEAVPDRDEPVMQNDNYVFPTWLEEGDITTTAQRQCCRGSNSYIYKDSCSNSNNNNSNINSDSSSSKKEQQQK